MFQPWRLGGHTTGPDSSCPCVPSWSLSSASALARLPPPSCGINAKPLQLSENAPLSPRAFAFPSSCLSWFFGPKKPLCPPVSHLKGLSTSEQAPCATLSPEPQGYSGLLFLSLTFKVPILQGRPRGASPKFKD